MWHLWGASPDHLVILRNNNQDMNAIYMQKRHTVSVWKKGSGKTCHAYSPVRLGSHDLSIPVRTQPLSVFFQINSKIKS